MLRDARDGARVIVFVCVCVCVTRTDHLFLGVLRDARGGAPPYADPPPATLAHDQEAVGKKERDLKQKQMRPTCNARS